MAKDSKNHPSTLAQVPIAFEYDVSWQDAKKAIKIRTHKQ
jgi:hypothetical protein